MLSFSKGSQQCIGISLAYAEPYLTLGRLFRAYMSKETSVMLDLGVLELYESTGRDMGAVCGSF